MLESMAPQSRAALSATTSITGWRVVGELEMTRRISLVAVCCSSASLRALVISAHDGAGRPLGLAVRGVPHTPQNFILGACSCWHPGQGMLASPESGSLSCLPEVKPHGTRAAAGARRSGRSWGSRATRPHRDPASDARWAVLGRGSPWSLWGRRRAGQRSGAPGLALGLERPTIRETATLRQRGALQQGARVRTAATVGIHGAGRLNAGVLTRSLQIPHRGPPEARVDRLEK
jgi:hypothetical protein